MSIIYPPPPNQVRCRRNLSTCHCGFLYPVHPKLTLNMLNNSSAMLQQNHLTILTNLSIETNSVDQDQTASVGAI